MKKSQITSELHTVKQLIVMLNKRVCELETRIAPRADELNEQDQPVECNQLDPRANERAEEFKIKLANALINRAVHACCDTKQPLTMRSAIYQTIARCACDAHITESVHNFSDLVLEHLHHYTDEQAHLVGAVLTY